MRVLSRNQTINGWTRGSESSVVLHSALRFSFDCQLVQIDLLVPPKHPETGQHFVTQVAERSKPQRWMVRSSSNYFLAISEDRSNLLESAKKVGAQSPTKIPKRSACAFDSAASPPVRNHMAIEPIMDANPSTKQRVDRFLKSEGFICLTCGNGLGTRSIRQV